MRLGAFLMLAAVPAAFGQIDKRIDAIVDASSVAARGFVGIEVVALDSGKELYGRNAGRAFVPASNTKLFSTALALLRLGGDFRFETKIYAEPSGDLVLYGSGDPSLSGRVYPYQKDPPHLPGLRAIEELADQVVAAGIRRIEGDVVGDDTAIAWEPYPPGWTVEDEIRDYGAPVSALTLNENAFSLTVLPGRSAGAVARLTLEPALEYYFVDNRVETVGQGETRIKAERLPGSRQIRLTGTITLASRGVTETLAIDDPALYAAYALADALARRGVVIHGRPIARHRPAADAPTRPSGELVAQRVSPSLVELLRVADKVSQNLHAELMLRTVARVKRGNGTRAAGLDEMKAFLAEIGIDSQDYYFEDASGLTRQTLVAPRAITKLLAFLYQSAERRNWIGLLPIAGQDGTLSNRFATEGGSGDSHAERIQAKTGSLSHVAALSGYADSASHGMLVFSIVVNNGIAPASEIRQFIDRIGLALLE